MHYDTSRLVWSLASREISLVTKKVPLPTSKVSLLNGIVYLSPTCLSLLCPHPLLLHVCKKRIKSLCKKKWNFASNDIDCNNTSKLDLPQWFPIKVVHFKMLMGSHFHINKVSKQISCWHGETRFSIEIVYLGLDQRVHSSKKHHYLIF